MATRIEMPNATTARVFALHDDFYNSVVPVGQTTSPAFVLTLGDVSGLPRGKQVVSYLALIPREYS